MKTVIEMAREAAGDDWGLFQEYMPEIHRLVELVRSEEREACARVVEDYPYWLGMTAKAEISNAIRALGQPPSPPAPRKPLTNEQIFEAYRKPLGQYVRSQDKVMILQFARAIEAAHNIKE